jgi:salicylate hydroxylase
MKIVIVGAGIGGLSAAIAVGRQGHQVVVYESAPRLAEIGAGVQLGPNAVRIWFDWGLGPELLEKALNPQELFIHHWKDGCTLGHCQIAGAWDKKFDAPYIVIHRADLHSILHRHALKHGVEVIVNSRVTDFDYDTPAITLASGEKVCADMVVAADGESLLVPIRCLSLTPNRYKLVRA